MFFIITKNLKTIESIESLINNHYCEDALGLIRSIYENYLQIMMIIHAPQQLLKELEVKVVISENAHVRKNNSFTVIQNKETSEEIILLTGIRKAALNVHT